MKTKSLLIKGLNITMSSEQLLEEFKTYEDEDFKFTKVRLFKTKKFSSQGYQPLIFMVESIKNNSSKVDLITPQYVTSVKLSIRTKI